MLLQVGKNKKEKTYCTSLETSLSMRGKRLVVSTRKRWRLCNHYYPLRPKLLQRLNRQLFQLICSY